MIKWRLLIFSLLAFSCASKTFAQVSSVHCKGQVADFNSDKVIKAFEFSPIIGEEELTNKAFHLPGMNMFVIASFFPTDESMGSAGGPDSLRLGIALSKRVIPQAFTAPNSAIAEVTARGFDTARVVTNVYIGRRRRLALVMECWDTELEKKLKG